jgi:outer membrane protein W
VYRLGIPHTVRVLPITATVGYQHRNRTALRPYIGGGIGAYRLSETSDFAAETDDVNQSHVGYHAGGGLIVQRGAMGVAVDVRFTTVPGAMKGQGVATEFGEENLGNVRVNFRVLFGN